MLAQLIGLLGLIVAISQWSAEAKNLTIAKSLAVDPVGRPHISVVRSERQRPGDVEPHVFPGVELPPAALGEMGDSFISAAGAEAIGERLAAAFQPLPKHKASVVQSNRSKADQAPRESPTAAVTGQIYLRQPGEHKGHFKMREWYCDACKLITGRGKYGGDKQGCYTVTDFVCAGGEKCLMFENECYFGRVELPLGIKVTYYSDFTGDPNNGAWSNACVGRTDRGTTSDPTFSELKGLVPTSPPVCAMQFDLIDGYSCDKPPGKEEWKKCGTEEFPPQSHAAAGSSVFLAAMVVIFAVFHSWNMQCSVR